jgi:hypothetical protein
MGDEANGSKGPWWGDVKKLVWTLGPVTVAFFLFIGVMFGWLPSPMLQGLSDSTGLLTRNNRVLSEIRDEVTVHSREVREQQRALLTSLRQICRNTAKTPQQNEKCDDIAN